MQDPILLTYSHILPPAIHFYASKSNPRYYYAYRSALLQTSAFVDSLRYIGPYSFDDGIVLGMFRVRLYSGVKINCPLSVSVAVMFDGGYVVDGAYTCDFSQPASTYNGLTPFTITNTFLFTYNAVPGRAFTIDLGDVLRK